MNAEKQSYPAEWSVQLFRIYLIQMFEIGPFIEELAMVNGMRGTRNDRYITKPYRCTSCPLNNF